MEEQQTLEDSNDGLQDFQESAGALQRPESPKDYGKEAGKELSDLEIEGINVLATLAKDNAPARQDKERTADDRNTEIPRPEYNENTEDGARKKVPTEKGRQYTVDKMKNDRKTALSNITKQMNKIKPLLSSFSNQKLVRIETRELDELFVLMQDVHKNYLKALDDEDEIQHAIEWYDLHDKEVFTFKQSIVDYLNEAKASGKEEFDRSSKSKYSHSKRSSACGSSSRSYLIQAKAKTASLEIKAAFLKEGQALKMAAEELELKPGQG